FVSSHALAAVGQSTSIINMLVGFFMGLSTGAGVVIAQYFGAKETKKMQDSIHTSLALTLVLCVLFTILGIALSKPILVMIGSPKEVLPLAVIYLQIYFAGVSFSLIYNMGAGILRALGDSKNPLIYLVVSSLVNIVLDFVFVIYFHLGVAGVGIATTLAQLVSAILVMRELIHTDKDYKVYISKIRFSKPILSRIISIGIPAAL
ncbi:MAG TPA: MATE family efflux transporter, partial [Erysipelotrichaceae bacterium]|nr:MATE family efflux transporter [Erysipelotrichaceae bacterium]